MWFSYENLLFKGSPSSKVYSSRTTNPKLEIKSFLVSAKMALQKSLNIES